MPKIQTGAIGVLFSLPDFIQVKVPCSIPSRLSRGSAPSHATIRSNMAVNDPINYALGKTDAEHERLIRQAARFASFTERLFRDAGISPGQRGLDLGSGMGDVAMLVARIVGSTGEVVGLRKHIFTKIKNL